MKRSLLFLFSFSILLFACGLQAQIGLNLFDDISSLKTDKNGDAQISLSVSQKKKENTLRVDFDLTSGNYVQVMKDQSIDLSALGEYTWYLEGEANGQVLELKFEDSAGCFFGKKIPLSGLSASEWKKMTLKSDDIGYLWGGDGKKHDVVRIWFAISRGQSSKGWLAFRDFGFMKDDPSKKIGMSLSWDSMDSWSTAADKTAFINLKETMEGKDKVISATYSLEGGYWVEMKALSPSLPSRDCPIVFYIKSAANSTMEIKFIDKDGSVFGMKIPLENQFKDWTKVVVSLKNLEYWWGGDAAFGTMNYFSLAFSGQGSGTVRIKKASIGNVGLPLTLPTAGARLDPDREKDGFGFIQRRKKTMNPENPLVLKYLEVIQDISSPEKQLLPSNEDLQAQTFNNSLVAMAFILKKERARAERILDFYSNAVKKDNMDPTLQNFFYNNEARGFYQHVALRDDHQTKAYHDWGTADRWMGDMAWLLIAYKYYEKTYSSDKYAAITGLLRDLLLSWYKDDPQGGGYVQHGWRNGDKKLHEDGGHPEGNIDCYAAFKLTGDDAVADKIRVWLEREIGGKINLPLDLYTWRSLAFGGDSAELLNIPEYDLRYRKTLEVNGNKVLGFYHSANNDVNNIWLDGMGHIACAFFAVGNPDRGNFYADQLEAFTIKRVINGVETAAFPYTANAEGGFEWVQRDKGFISVSAWYIFAKNKFNPMTFK